MQSRKMCSWELAKVEAETGDAVVLCLDGMRGGFVDGGVAVDNKRDWKVQTTANFYKQ